MPPFSMCALLFNVDIVFLIVHAFLCPLQMLLTNCYALIATMIFALMQSTITMHMP